MTDIYVVTIKDFDSWNADYIVYNMSAIENSDQPVHILQIDSCGGYVTALNKILNFIDSSSKPVCSVIDSKAMSCGSVLAAYTDFTLMGNHSQFLIHEPSGISWGKYSDQLSDINEMRRILDSMYNVYDQRANKPPGFCRSLINQNNNADLFLSTQQAKEYGFIDGIGSINDLLKMDLNKIQIKRKRNDAVFYNHQITTH